MWIRRHQALFTAISVFVLALGLVFLAIIPIYLSTDKLLAKIDTKMKERDEIIEKVSILSQLDPEVLNDRVRVLDSALPSKKDILLYLNSIEGLSRDLGLTFGGLSLSPGDITESSESAKVASSARKKPATKKVAGLDSLDTEIKMRGNRDSIYTFLRTIEEVLPLMQIKDVKVSILASDHFSLTLTLGMLWAEPEVFTANGPVTLFGEEEDKYFTQLASYKTFIANDPKYIEEKSTKENLFAPFEVPTINIIEESSSSGIILQ